MVEKLFDGSPELLLTQLVSDRKLSPQDIRRLRKILDQRLKGGAR
jgi:predicted transcriptional regulator